MDDRRWEREKSQNIAENKPEIGFYYTLRHNVNICTNGKSASAIAKGWSYQRSNCEPDICGKDDQEHSVLGHLPERR
jgi:hypothetical protein